jgi:hypothetical protein
MKLFYFILPAALAISGSLSAQHNFADKAGNPNAHSLSNIAPGENQLHIPCNRDILLPAVEEDTVMERAAQTYHARSKAAGTGAGLQKASDDMF